MKRLLISLLLGCVAFAQVAEKANEGYKTKEGRDAVGRSLAAPSRDKTERPRDLVEAMDLKPGMTVADIGTGVGYMLPYLSHAVGPTGTVIAEDIAQDFLDKARTRAQSTGLTNVRFVLGSDRDPKLPGGSVDAILVLDAYHHFDYPEAMLKNIRDSLVSDGRLYIVDYYKTANAMPNGRALEHIRLNLDEVVNEIESNGFRLVSKHEHVPGSQYMAAFEKKQQPEKR